VNTLSLSKKQLNSNFQDQLLRDHNVQQLIEEMISKKNNSELIPLLDANGNQVYQEVMELLHIDETRANTLIESLEKAEILKRKFVEMGITCPNCNSMKIKIKYHCIKCYSPNIDKQKIYEHIPCETQDTLEHFKTEGNLKCPKCHKRLQLNSTEFKKIESWFECKTCYSEFEEPKIIHICHMCGVRFPIKEVNLIPIYSHTLNEEAETKYKKDFILLNPVKDKLEKFGYLVEIPGILKGQSGNTHIFNLAASKKNKILVIDAVTAESQVNEIPIAAMLVKIYDVKPNKSILIAIPKLNYKAKGLVQIYKLNLVETESLEKAVHQIVRNIKEYL
jgi:hypothetical protein